MSSSMNFVANSNFKLNNVKYYTNTTNVTLDKFYSDKQINKVYDEYEEIDYNVFDLEKGIEQAKENANEQSWYKVIYDYTHTIRASFTWGVLEVVENLGDGLIMLVSNSMAQRASIVDSIFGTNFADKIKQTAADIIDYDWTEAGYQAEMKLRGVSDEISQGLAHTIAGGVGTAAGYVALSFIPGGAAVTATFGAVSAMGSATEMAFNCGATYEEALVVGSISAAAGAGAGAALSGISGAAKGATSLLQVVGYTAAGAAVSMTEPIVNTTAQYYTYAKDMVDENGNKLYDNWGDYYLESGGLLNTAIAGAAGGLSSGIRASQSYSGTQKYIKSNYADEFGNKKWNSAKERYDNKHGNGAFDKLSNQQKDALTQNESFTKKEISDLKKLATDNIKQNVKDSINNVSSDYKNGKYDKKYSVGDILADYKGDQTKYWSENALAAYYNEFLQNADSNGNVKVYCFQDGTSGAKNYNTFNGNIGYPDGCFVMSEDAYQKLLKDNKIFNSAGQVIDSGALGKYLGGVDFGGSKNIIALEHTVNISDIKIPNGSYQGAFPGYWSPGGKTISTATGKAAATEAVIPQGNISNGNVKIIQH